MASVVQQNVFDLLGEGEEDIQTLAAKLPAAAKPAPKKEEAKPGEPAAGWGAQAASCRGPRRSLGGELGRGSDRWHTRGGAAGGP